MRWRSLPSGHQRLAALARRAAAHNLPPLPLPLSRTFDLAGGLKAQYGEEYVGDPRLQKLIELNNINSHGLLSLGDLTAAFREGRFWAMANSLGRKLAVIGKVLELALTGRLLVGSGEPAPPVTAPGLPLNWRRRMKEILRDAHQPQDQNQEGTAQATREVSQESASVLEGEYGPRMSAGEANSRALELARADPSFATEPRVRKWAKAIGCSEGLVSKLPFWRATMERTGRGRKDNSPAPKVVSLTRDVEAVSGEGDRDEQLRRLIAEHKADEEPSPLDDTSRKVRTRKRL
jgi:hypothetical protein